MIVLNKPLPYVNITPIQIVMALAILIIGWIVAKVIVGTFKKSLKKTKLPELVVEFLGRFLSALFYVVILLLAIRALGVHTGSVVLGLSAVIGLVLGFGMQDTLTNIAAGIWLAAFRPFDMGEVVTIGGYTGKVEGIGIMATELFTF